ncbi:hypothetical protein ACWEPN_02660 [Nonomuraea wenchangensis]
MEVAKLILEYLKVIVWPVFAGIIVFGFRQSVQRLLNRISEFDGLGVSAKFEQQVSELAEEASAIEGATASTQEKEGRQATSDAYPPADPGFSWAKNGTEAGLRGGFDGARASISDGEPQIAIAFAWSQLASVLDEVGLALKVRGLDRTDSQFWLRRLRELRYGGGAIGDMAPKVAELYHLRNKALHDPRLKPSASAAASFVDAAEDLAVALFRLLVSGELDRSGE